MSSNSKACKAGCQCGRHNSKHKPDCKCNRCMPRSKDGNVIPLRQRKRRNPEQCVCGHIDNRHDYFGCKTCESRGKVCAKFRSVAKHKYKANKARAYDQEVQDEGFVEHHGELATCTSCWEPIKIGVAHTLSCVITARAHSIKCRENGVRPVNKHRPNRTG